MTIILNAHYKITTDPLNFVLYELKTVKKKGGDEVQEWTVSGYYADEKQCVHACLKKGIMESELNGLKEITGYLEVMAHEILNKMKWLPDTCVPEETDNEE